MLIAMICAFGYPFLADELAGHGDLVSERGGVVVHGDLVLRRPLELRQFRSTAFICLTTFWIQRNGNLKKSFE
jgi:hypothetical protein